MNTEWVDMTKAVATELAPYAMLCNNAYHAVEKKAFPVSELGWTLVDDKGEKTASASVSYVSGFACDIYEHDSMELAVIAFRGTEGLVDWIANLGLPKSIQYENAENVTEAYRNRGTGRTLTVVGHSLGGGLAMSVSARLGIDAVAFNPSPRVFDKLGDNHKQAHRRLVYQDKDPLMKLGKKWDKLKALVEPQHRYLCSFDYEGEGPHRIDLLAYHLVMMSGDDKLTKMVGDH